MGGCILASPAARLHSQVYLSYEESIGIGSCWPLDLQLGWSTGRIWGCILASPEARLHMDT